MVNAILNAVTKRLGTSFGNSYKYHVEDVEQGLETPCFKVDVLIPLTRSKSPILYDRTMPIVIHYFSDSKYDLKNDLNLKGEEIVECLEYLPFLNTILRGEDISYQIVDNVLQVFVTYKFTTMRTVDIGELFEGLEVKASTPNVPIDTREKGVLGVGVIGILKLGNY